MRLLLLLVVFFGLAAPTHARDAYAQAVNDDVGPKIKAITELRRAATPQWDRTVRVDFTVQPDGSITNVKASSRDATINLLRLVERNVRSIGRTIRSPTGKPRRFTIQLAF